MDRLANGLGYFDLSYQGLPQLIATAVIQGPSGVVLIDPGPSTTLPTLKRNLAASGMGVADVTGVLVTHIHLDHSGSCGALLRENSRIRVWVHERGAPHLIDPQKLVASATRLWPDSIGRLFGECLPVPREAIVTLHDGERLEIEGHRVEVAYTPGHAVHHVSYFVPDAGIAFVGDTAGVRLPSGGFVLPPTPPPDIDIDAWLGSLQRIGAWGAHTLFLTHFGPFMAPGAHLADVRGRLEWQLELVKTSLAQAGDDETRKAWFVEQVRDEFRRVAGIALTESQELAGRFDLNWLGLVRYLKKRA